MINNILICIFIVGNTATWKIFIVGILGDKIRIFKSFPDIIMPVDRNYKITIILSKFKSNRYRMKYLDLSILKMKPKNANARNINRL
jgi:hypothetical protein